jgi:hypothetical protein
MAGGCECVGCVRIVQEARFGGPAGRAHVNAVGYREKAGPGRDQGTVSVDTVRDRLGIAVEIDHERMPRTRRHVPGDHPLAVARLQDDGFRLGKSNCRRGDRPALRVIEQRALKRVEEDNDGDIADEDQRDHPPQGVHECAGPRARSIQVGSRRALISPILEQDPVRKVGLAGSSSRTTRTPSGSPPRPIAAGTASCRPLRRRRCAARSPDGPAR